MKALLFSAVLTLHAIAVQAQSSCCTPPTTGMQLLASRADFIAAHEAPAPINFQESRGSMIQFETLDAGRKGNAYYLPSPQATGNVLIVVHEWWGLNDYIKREAQRLQDSLGNVDVYAIDLYDGKVAATEAEASQYSSGLERRRGENIVKGLLSTIGPNKRIATWGWCVGGTWAFNAAVLAERQAAGAVVFYGFPETDTNRIAQIKSDVLYVRADLDKFISAEQVANLKMHVEKAGYKFELHNYAADHAFANPSNPKYNAPAAGFATAEGLRFLREKLQLIR